MVEAVEDAVLEQPELNINPLENAQDALLDKAREKAEEEVKDRIKDKAKEKLGNMFKRKNKDEDAEDALGQA